MDNCTLYLVVLGLVVFGDVIILLNVHRIVKPLDNEMVQPGGEVKPGPSRVQFLRMAIGASIVLVIAVFLFLLSQEGCLA